MCFLLSGYLLFFPEKCSKNASNKPFFTAFFWNSPRFVVCWRQLPGFVSRSLIGKQRCAYPFFRGPLAFLAGERQVVIPLSG